MTTNAPHVRSISLRMIMLSAISSNSPNFSELYCTTASNRSLLASRYKTFILDIAHASYACPLQYSLSYLYAQDAFLLRAFNKTHPTFRTRMT